MKSIKLDQFWAVLDSNGSTNCIKDKKKEALNLSRIIGGSVIKIRQVWHRDKCILNIQESLTATLTD